MSIDPRLAERRRTVAEERAKQNVSRLLRFLIVLLFLGAVAWLAVSPWLSVSQVHTSGIVSSDAHSALVSEGVVAGRPMVLMRPWDAEDALESDPWIKEASVELAWPDEVIVSVEERVPVLWVESEEGWTWHAPDGVAIPGPGTPDPASPQLVVPDLSTAELEESPLVLGSAEFVIALPEPLSRGMRLRVESGELWTSVEGFEVRLGRPVEMTDKALTLAALLAENLEPGSVLILVAPHNPSVDPPADAPGDDETVSGDGDGTADETGSTSGESEEAP